MGRTLSALGILFIISLLPIPALADIYIDSPYILMIADTTLQDMVIGTSYSYSPTYASLLYDMYYSTGTETIYYSIGTSHIVFNIDGIPYDLDSGYTVGTAMTASSPATGLGAYIEGSEVVSNIDLRSHYEIVNNVITGSRADMIELKYTATNNGGVSHNIGCRVELDTEVNSVDGTNISIDNGNSVISTSSSAWIWKTSSGTIPTDWWDYDVPPPGTATLVGRGALYNNSYGEAATKPDVFEVADWNTVNGIAQWTLSSSAPTTDSAVVIWWTGTGSESGLSQVLGPGQSITWITYYGLNQGVLRATFTPTPTNTPTPTLTFTTTATSTSTPTITPTFTHTFTGTETWTTTETATSTDSPSPTDTPTATLSDTPTMTATVTPRPSPTDTPTVTSTSTFTTTPTISSTPTVSPTTTLTPTVTPTPIGLHVWPNPFTPQKSVGGVLKAYLCPSGSSMEIYTVSGELVNTEREVNGLIEWDGRNDFGNKVSSGIYYYAIKKGDRVLLTGKLLVTL